VNRDRQERVESPVDSPLYAHFYSRCGDGCDGSLAAAGGIALAFANHVARVFVVAKRNEPGMAKMVVGGPLRELELPD
jgi:hypothetical protein